MPRWDMRKHGSFRGYALASGLQDPAVFGPETFVERVSDDGMVPRISRGDYVYVDPDGPAADGSVVLFGRGADARSEAAPAPRHYLSACRRTPQRGSGGRSERRESGSDGRRGPRRGGGCGGGFSRDAAVTRRTLW